MKQELRHTSPFLKAVVGRGLLTSSRAPTIQSRRGHQCGGSKGSALRLRLTGSVVQPRVSDDLVTYKAIGSNYLSFVVTSMLVSTSPLDEAGTATHFPLSESSGRKGPANVVSSADHPITSGSPVWRVKRERAPIAVNRLSCTTSSER